MGTIVGTKETLITTNEGLKLVRRERTVKMPNGKYRHPVDYYDATPGAVAVTPQERWENGEYKDVEVISL